MWQRFTERARRTVFFAQEEAGKRRQSDVAPEHLFLALLREDDSVAIRVMEGLDVDLKRAAEAIRRKIPNGAVDGPQQMQMSVLAKRVIDFSYDEARRLNNNYIGTEHILLGLIREDGICAAALLEEDVDLMPPPDTDDVFEEGYHIRVLEGDYAGYAGWIFKSAFYRTGFDDAPFPPVETQ